MECGSATWRLSLWFVIATASSFASINGQETQKISLLMPNVVPQYVDSYLCTAVRLDPTEEYYITAFEPNSTMDIAHHMFISGAPELHSTEKVWDCGDMTRHEEGKHNQIIYAWANDAPMLNLPEGVGFKVGGKTSIQYIVLQVHYRSISKFKDGVTDDSGVVVYYTKAKMPKLAGVLLLGTDGRILPKTIEHFETACTLTENITIHPFAYRTHTHSLGRVVAGYKIAEVNGTAEWTLIGKKDPQLPQMFYSVPYDIAVSKGETLASRCTIENTRDSIVRVGLRVEDEMCSFFIMYWKERKYDETKFRKTCLSKGPPEFYWETGNLTNIPEDASTLNVDEMTNEIM